MFINTSGSGFPLAAIRAASQYDRMSPAARCYFASPWFWLVIAWSWCLGARAEGEINQRASNAKR
ncbi:MAG TPA: hypothetical protein VF607_11650, partial [Verrucomicrobiae bacterium]